MVSNYTPLRVRSHFSLGISMNKPKKIVETCANLGLKSCGLIDRSTLAGSVQFVQACEKKGIKPILGCEFNISRHNGGIKSTDNVVLGTVILIAKNLAGWGKLVKMVSQTNSPSNCYDEHPKLSFDEIQFFLDEKNECDLILITGYPNSLLCNSWFGDDYNKANRSDEPKSFVSGDWVNMSEQVLEEYDRVFGKENVLLAVEAITDTSISKLTVQASRYLGKKTQHKCISFQNTCYCKPSDMQDNEIITCQKFNIPFQDLHKHEFEDYDLAAPIENRYIATMEEMCSAHIDQELENSNHILDMCEDYSILQRPSIPNFTCPDGLTPKQYLRQLAEDGFKTKIKKDVEVYRERLEKELAVIENVNIDLPSYFLIVQDIVNYGKRKGWLMGPARGSCGGCLVAYLIGIISIDPIPNKLIFERFYNAGRNTATKVSLPDIDMDVPTNKREELIHYIQEKYGHENISQMVTFHALKGRSALKACMRAFNSCSAPEQNKICSFIPDEAKIADQLEDMRNARGEASIIQWALENNQKELQEWCWINPEGELEGPFSPLFAQAMRLEGVKLNQSKHAAGLIIGANPLKDGCPMLYDKSERQMIAGLEMNDLEAMGHVKFDVLGVAILDKISGALERIKGNGQKQNT